VPGDAVGEPLGWGIDMSDDRRGTSIAATHAVRGRLRDLQAIGGLAVLTVIVWGWPVLRDFASRRLSLGGDSNSFEFYLGWNVHAVLRGESFFSTPALYAPEGMDLGNAISIPAVSFLVSPVTVLFGTTAAYNTAMLLAVFAAAASVHLLARELFGSVAGAALAGGLVVLSPYFAGHILGHANLMWIWELPFVVFLVVRHVHGRVRARWLVAGTAAAVTFSLGSSTELFVTQSLFGALAAIVALVATADRRHLARSLLMTAAGGAAGVVLALPVIAAAVRAGIPETVQNPPVFYSTDLANILVPTSLAAVGGSWFAELERTVWGNVAENTAYVPLGMLVVVVIALITRRDRITRSLLAIAAVVVVASLGPLLTIAGHRSITMPWRLAEQVPGLDHALPVRFSAYLFIVVALVVASLWAGRGVPRWVTAALVGVSAVLLLPSMPASYPYDAETPEYIASGFWQRDIDRGDNVLVLPSGQNGNGMLWQTRTDFAFTMPTGNAGGAKPPPEALRPVGNKLINNDLELDWKAELPSYLEERDVRTILVENRSGDAADWRAVVDDVFPGVGRLDHGVWVYRVP